MATSMAVRLESSLCNLVVPSAVPKQRNLEHVPCNIAVERQRRLGGWIWNIEIIYIYLCAYMCLYVCEWVFVSLCFVSSSPPVTSGHQRWCVCVFLNQGLGRTDWLKTYQIFHFKIQFWCWFLRSRPATMVAVQIPIRIQNHT